jgi:hypothetical protein
MVLSRTGVRSIEKRHVCAVTIGRGKNPAMKRMIIAVSLIGAIDDSQA